MLKMFGCLDGEDEWKMNGARDEHVTPVYLGTILLWREVLPALYFLLFTLLYWYIRYHRVQHHIDVSNNSDD
jgi:hypothetical protein